jgi:hypothetical protein
MAHSRALCLSVPRWAVPFQHRACLVFPLTTTTFLVGSPLVVTRWMKAVIRTRIANERAQNAAAVHPHQGLAPAPAHAARAATQTRVEAIPQRPPQPGAGVATFDCYPCSCPRSSLSSPRRSQPSDGPRTVTDYRISCATTYITSLHAC